MSQKAMLIIMDGWGLGQIPNADAIQQAQTPFVSSLYGHYPHTTLVTCGEAVGLPEGQMGNSEVGHLNLGAGRVVYQELQRIHVAIRSGELAQHPVLLDCLAQSKAPGKKLHLMGLVSDGGVHSHTAHLKALLDTAHAQGVEQVFVHAFTDGRDTDPKSGLGYLTDLEKFLSDGKGKIASVSGRYYAMDRDKRWERVALAYQALTGGTAPRALSAVAALEAAYAAGTTDEFFLPTIITDAAGHDLAHIADGDVVICFNFRTDRCREITEVLTQVDHPDHGMHKLSLHYTTMTRYDQNFKNVSVIFENDNLNNTLGEVLADAGKTQLRAAETEKYPHVTFFFSGGREAVFPGEERVMAPSPKVATYDLQPAMSAPELTAAVLVALEKNHPDFLCLNYANADMVGHTGVFSAAVAAAETVDGCVRQVVEWALAHQYAVFLTADHGNADFMVNADGSPNTAHTLNPVPLFYISSAAQGKLTPGKLGDLAPTILSVMGLAIPAEMTGKVLLNP